MVGYDGPIYMTHPTQAICPILLEDYRKIAVDKKGEANFFTSQMIKDCMKKVVAVHLHQTVQVRPAGAGLWVAWGREGQAGGTFVPSECGGALAGAAETGWCCWAARFGRLGEAVCGPLGDLGQRPGAWLCLLRVRVSRMIRRPCALSRLVLAESPVGVTRPLSAGEALPLLALHPVPAFPAS